MPSLPIIEHLHAADIPEYVRTPAVTYLTVEGRGAPGTDEFYRKKLLVSHLAAELTQAGTAPAVEIQYWYPDGSAHVEIADFYSVNPIPSLLYRVLVQIPTGTTQADIEAARVTAASPADSGGDEINLFSMGEQDVVQVMHHGPFAEEFATLMALGEFAREKGLRRNGPHHELHLDDFTRSTPQENLRTILRDPVL